MSFSMSPFPLRFGSRQGGGGEPWTPLALPSLIAWRQPGLSSLFQDAAGTTPAVADDPVGLITDLASVGPYNATQGTADQRPLYKTADGKHWLEYDGTNDVLSQAVPFSQITIGIALRFISVPSTAYAIAATTDGTTYYLRGFSTALTFSGTNVFCDVVGVDHVVVCTWSATTRILNVLGETPVQASVAAPGANTWATEGARLSGGANPANVRIYGSVYCNAALVGDDLTNLQSYLQSLLPGF